MLFIVFISFFLLPIFFLPTIIAGNRRLTGKMIVVVLLLNILTGWTGIGWFIALIVASTSNPKV